MDSYPREVPSYLTGIELCRDDVSNRITRGIEKGGTDRARRDWASPVPDIVTSHGVSVSDSILT